MRHARWAVSSCRSEVRCLEHPASGAVDGGHAAGPVVMTGEVRPSRDPNWLSKGVLPGPSVFGVS